MKIRSFVEAIRFTQEIQSMNSKGLSLVIGGDSHGDWVLLRNDTTDHIVGSLEEAKGFIQGWDAAKGGDE